MQYNAPYILPLTRKRRKRRTWKKLIFAAVVYLVPAIGLQQVIIHYCPQWLWVGLSFFLGYLANMYVLALLRWLRVWQPESVFNNSSSN